MLKMRYFAVALVVPKTRWWDTGHAPPKEILKISWCDRNFHVILRQCSV